MNLSTQMCRSAWAGLALLLSACGGSGEQNITIDLNLSRDARWAADIEYMTGRMTTVHPNLYHSFSATEFNAAKKALLEDIPRLDDHGLFARLLQLFALPGQERDLHMAVSYFDGTDNLINPLKFYRFEGGVFLIQSLDEHQDFIGGELLAIDGLPLSEANAILDSIIPRDNQQSLEVFRNFAYINPAVLYGLGIGNSPTATTYSLRLENNEVVEMPVTAISPINFPLDPSHNLPKDNTVGYLNKRGDLWLEHFEENATVYIKLNRMVESSGGVSLNDLAQQTLAIVQQAPGTKVVLDLRQNNGGNNELVGDIIDFLRHPEINRPDRLLVFTDRQVLSAAGNLVAELDYRTQATFIGVPPGGSGSQYGDAKEYRLPYSGITIYLPTRFWQFGDPDHQPLSQTMDVWMEPGILDYLTKRDPLFERFVLARTGQ
ncbi:hypothetical protein P2G88_03795 [Aliiglaciecola sp. CAU 1673]|uniref:hypothetical protein n=1 Tax=Aliiglaciecola sp. CAU 1673 TaxID=3032595 RepID=UPI0023DCA112|nr:hypothetical protein [Aliiglaciecola sp. CAU 1673]MDF2177367.1 hypothetical protein [Aliiglaciecola sp. CAU 1673]